MHRNPEPYILHPKYWHVACAAVTDMQRSGVSGFSQTWKPPPPAAKSSLSLPAARAPARSARRARSRSLRDAFFVAASAAAAAGRPAADVPAAAPAAEPRPPG